MLIYIGRNEAMGENCRWFSQEPEWRKCYHGDPKTYKVSNGTSGYEKYLGAWWSNNHCIAEMSYEATEFLTRLKLKPGGLKVHVVVYRDQNKNEKELLKRCINPLSQCSCPDATKIAHEIRDLLIIKTDMWEKLNNSCTEDCQ